MDLVEVGFRSRRLKHLAFLLVVGDGFEGEVHVLEFPGVFADTEIDEAYSRVEFHPAELFPESLSVILRVKHQRICRYRRAKPLDHVAVVIVMRRLDQNQAECFFLWSLLIEYYRQEPAFTNILRHRNRSLVVMSKSLLVRRSFEK